MFLKFFSSILFITFGFFLGSYSSQEKTVVFNRIKIVKEYVEKPIIIKESFKVNRNIAEADSNYFENNTIPSSPSQDVRQSIPMVSDKKFRFKLLAGYGVTGRTQIIENHQSIKFNSIKGAIYGAGLDYKINSTYSIGTQVLSNQSVLGSIGYDF